MNYHKDSESSMLCSSAVLLRYYCRLQIPNHSLSKKTNKSITQNKKPNKHLKHNNEWHIQHSTQKNTKQRNNTYIATLANQVSTQRTDRLVRFCCVSKWILTTQSNKQNATALALAWESNYNNAHTNGFQQTFFVCSSRQSKQETKQTPQTQQRVPHPTLNTKTHKTIQQHIHNNSRESSVDTTTQPFFVFANQKHKTQNTKQNNNRHIVNNSPK